jgi:pimeloyl-ACP methyl ester carboxylesterase
MSSFVLVHGAHHGGWCWYKVAALLEAQGHRVLAVDLPGHGRNAGAPGTMRSYIDYVSRLLETEAEPVILVGHSMGGAVITGVGEACPNKIAHLVYVTAFLAENGVSMTGALSAQAGADGMVPVSDLSELVYHDCPVEDAMLARLCQTPQAVEPLVTPVMWTAERWGNIPRTYIGCTLDRVFPIAEQRRRTAIHPGANWVELESSHSPFFSMPAKLVAYFTALTN